MRPKFSALLTALLSAQLIFPADLPVRQVVLYKHGVAFYERQGTVNENEEVRLDFQNNEMNDVLKSLTVTDLSGGHIRGVRYDSNETPEQRLAKFPFQIGETVPFSTFLDTLKGAQIQLTFPDSTKVSGAILGSREVDKHGQISVLLDRGDVANYPLEKVSSLRFEDPRLQEDLKEYLRTLAQSKSREKRSVYIESEGTGSRQLRAAYIAPTAIWKSSYRLTLDEAGSMLEGWAIVDNTTDEDWLNVKLSVVSGRPISFISLLDTPRYGNRQVAELPEDRAAGPIVYGGSIQEFSLFQGSARTGAVGGVIGGVGVAPPPVPEAPKPLASAAQTVEVSPSSVEGATGATLGELFEYNFAGPITVKKNQSAMLPFLQDKVRARKLLIFTVGRDGEHPVNAAEVTNGTGKTLDGGPITIYEANAYAGEALFETLKSGDKRLVGYAVDYGTRVEQDSDDQDRTTRTITAKNGLLEIHYGQRSTLTYTAHNVDAKPKTLLIEQPQGEYQVLSPKPVERTADAYRFELKLAPNATQELKVEQEASESETIALTNATPDQLLTLISTGKLSASAHAALEAIAELKRRIVDAGAKIDTSKSRMDELTNEQSRLRANIDSLNRVKGQDTQVSGYSNELASNEVQIAKLREELHQFIAEKTRLESDLRNSMARLRF